MQSNIKPLKHFLPVDYLKGAVVAGRNTVKHCTHVWAVVRTAGS